MYPDENGEKNLVLSGGLFVKLKVAMFCQTNVLSIPKYGAAHKVLHNQCSTYSIRCCFAAAPCGLGFRSWPMSAANMKDALSPCTTT